MSDPALPPYPAAKDRPLDATIEDFGAHLAKLGFHLGERHWLNPVPGVYSLNLAEAGSGLYTNGKGATAEAARASALGEFVERLASGYFFADHYLGPELSAGEWVHLPEERWLPFRAGELPAGLLDDELLAHFDPEGELRPEHLVDGNSARFDRGICCQPLTRQSDGATRWFPVGLLAGLYASNGLSAGNTATETRVQGLSEVFERHAKGRLIAEGWCPPVVPESVLARYPHIQEGLTELTRHGYRVRPVDASLDGAFPVAGVILSNPFDGGVFASFGAHPSFGIALERALTELLQGRGLEGLAGFPTPSPDVEAVADPVNLEAHFIDSSGQVAWQLLRDTPDYPFRDWDFTTDNATAWAHLLDIAHGQGCEVYVADYAHLGIPACRLVVPGMSEVYPVDDLWLNNANEGAFFRERILSLPDLDAPGHAGLLEELEEGGFNDFQTAAEFIGVVPEPDTAWASLRLGELKAWLAIAAGEAEAASDWVDWTLLAGQLGPERHRVFLALRAILDLESEGGEIGPYRAALAGCYGETALATAEAALDGREPFPGLGRPGPELSGFAGHHALWEAYRHLRTARDPA
jgi:ribosomal protein S12 methylthiotransferase accessory factor